ncbi:MAG TPA: dinitrogenase iron-molybdenum cofactor [bacterium (Candidatus Stahlbacteria)]|nr:dinitrogenase iron-molybdenum cofactor [Candidatus Stahlbacteria bacterium]
MRVAVSTDGGMVSPHFGRCQGFTIAEIEDGEIKKTELIANPGHQPGFLPDFLSAQGVSLIICGGMGVRAQSLFEQKGIDFLIGVTGSVEDVLDKLARGELAGGESLCPKDQGLEVEPCDDKEEK